MIPYQREAWHLVTCEFPPQLGGVAAFTKNIAGALAAAGREVHVWTPGPADVVPGLVLHPLEGAYRVRALGPLDRALDACPAPRRLFVQWVPHGFGYKSLNVPFCLWVQRRARQGDTVDLMVHEPFLPFDASRMRQNVGAAVHRAMLAVLLRAADRAWVSTPSFIPALRPYAPRRLATPGWLPVSSPVEPVHDPTEVRALRQALAGDAPLVGHFGTCGPLAGPPLASAVRRIAALDTRVRFLLLGHGTERFAQEMVREAPALGGRIVASGARDARKLSLLAQCCDVFVQPYPDGVSARRTTLMALLEHGAAIVVTDGLRTEPWWHTSGALRTAPAEDAEALASATIDLLRDPAARVALGAAARRLYLARFTAARAADLLLDRQSDRVSLPA